MRHQLFDYEFDISFDINLAIGYSLELLENELGKTNAKLQHTMLARGTT